MKINEVYVIVITLIIFGNVDSIALNHKRKYVDEYYNEDFGNINTLVESFEMLKKKEKNNYFDNFEKNLVDQPIRFKQKGINNVKSNNMNNNDIPMFNDELIFSKSFTDELAFDDIEDKEIKRKEGISNGQVLYQGKRTANIETFDFKNLYYNLIE